MVAGLRSTKPTSKASDNLGRLDLGHRGAALLKQSGAALTTEDDLTDSAIAKEKRAVGGASRTVADRGTKAGVTSAKGAARGAVSVGRVLSKTIRGVATEIRGNAGAGLAKGRLAAPARGGVVAAARRRAAATSGSATGKAAAVAQVRSARAAAQATRQAIQAATFVGRLVASLLASLSSTPTLIVTVTIAAVLAILLTFLAFIPSIAKQSQDQGSDLLTGGSFPITDDYPYKDAGFTTMNPESGYYFGNCTDFVWWRINRDAGITQQPWKLRWADLTPNGGNGGQWANPGNLPGWTDTRAPVAGDVISIHHGGTLGASAADPGHVGYIAAVDDSGGVTIENYGNGHYFITKTTVSEIDQFIDNGWVGVKHNPAGRVGGTADGDANGDAKAFAQQQLNDPAQFQCLDSLWIGESGWNPLAENSSSGAFGIPQALPGNKMASAGDDWQTNPITQVKWGLDYIRGKYGTPCSAWFQWQTRVPHWY
ncbi:CHAP domain-containing protein [Clavibacter michiganensis]|uniref:CHAP domain-containing protein n=1 Tax=Clavibacter michiganensis TaxID=28447 RepID=UPI00292FF83A|nr:CHAP domain-containing protein [Clavibacter michiganensis]